jgi:hypothetical protein
MFHHILSGFFRIPDNPHICILYIPMGFVNPPFQSKQECQAASRGRRRSRDSRLWAGAK